MKYYKYFFLALAVIVLDQAVKLFVHFNMELGANGQITVFGDWFKLYYTLNPGMAFGMQFGSEFGKLGLSLFRLVAMFFIAYYLYRLAKDDTHPGVLWSLALILGGAMGNVLDSTFYGVLLDNAPY
ncbi:lipoprotein signal peptidase, partial [Marivirga lumbricoides]